VTHRPIARQRLGKHIPAGANALNNRTPITRQRISKHSSLTTEAMFLRGLCKVGSEESSFGKPACQDMSLGAEELN
jgi:hypothetical protein